MTSELTVAETYIFSITLYIITILALIGAIHLIYNICKCKRKCHKCFKCINKWNHRNNIGINNRSVLTRSRSNNKHNNNTDNNKDTNIKDKQQHRRDRDRDIDMDISDSDSALNESFISKLCKIVCVLTVINFLIFLFFGCYQQSMYNHNQKSNNNSINFPIFSYHIISQCRILFCMIGFYIYGKMLLYIYFVIRAYNMLEGSELNYNKTTVVCILSIYFIMMNFILFSMIYVHLTDDYCININNNTTIHKKRSIVFGIGATVDGSMAILSVSLLIHKLFALVRQSMLVHGWLDKITPHPSPQHTPRQSILSTTNTNTIIKPKTYEIKLTKQIEMSTSNALNNNNNNNKKIATFRRCSRTDDSDNDNDNDSTPNNNIVRNDIFPGSLPSSTRQSLQSYNNTNNIIINNRLDNRRISASITPSILIENDVFTINPNELQSIYSNEQLIDDDESITKIKKLNINKIKQIDMIEEANNNGFDMIEEEEEDDDENNKILLTLEDNIHDDDDDDDQSEEEEEEEEEKSPLQGTICNISNNNSNENKLQIPQVTPYNSNNSNISVISDRSPRNSILSLSRRSSSIFEMMQMKLNKASAIVSEISHEHIKRFHNVTQYDNEILLLSTKLLILLTICVISSFCSFLLLFGIIRTNANNGIFFVYGIDSFINIWCLNFTFKFSNKCYNILFNCGKKNQCTKCCFPMVKTAALTWKFCCCYKRKYKLNIRQKSNIKKPPKMPKNGHHMVAQNSVTYNYQLSNNNNKDDNIEFEDIEINNNQHSNEHSNNNDESQCHMNCCFCCWGNKQDIHIYHLARGEVELMLTQNSKLYK